MQDFSTASDNNSYQLSDINSQAIHGQTSLNPGLMFFCLGFIALLILSLSTQARLTQTAPIILIYCLIAIIYAHLQSQKRKSLHNAGDKARLKQDHLQNTAEKMLDYIPLPAAFIDEKGRLIQANDQAKALIGITDHIRPLTHYIRDANLISALGHANIDTAPEPVIVKIDTPSERYIRLFFSKSQPFDRDALDRDGLDNIIFILFEDMTDRHINQKLRADFLANASHELKTPIASLLGYIETLQSHAKDDPQAREKFLKIMYSQAERMQRLIEDLLSLRQIEQSAHIMPSGIGDLHLAILSALDSITPMSTARGIKILYDNQAQDTTFMGRQDEAVQMCLNIISNAVKISPKGHAVNITLKIRRDWKDHYSFQDSQLSPLAHKRQIIAMPPSDQPVLHLTISDRGGGFAREHIPRIGERFYRVNQSTNYTHEKGTGLGLAIVKHIVKRHRGGFYLRSEEGVGSEFSVSLIQPSPVQGTLVQESPT